MRSFVRQAMRHARPTSLLAYCVFFSLGMAIKGPLAPQGRLRILLLVFVGTLCMGGWAYAQDEFRLWRGRIAGQKRFGLEFPQPVHLGMDALVCAGSLASLLVLALFASLTALGLEFLVAFGVGVAAAAVFVRFFCAAHLANLWQDIDDRSNAEKAQAQAARQAHLDSTERTIRTLLKRIRNDAHNKLEQVYLAEHRIDASRKSVATHQPVDLPPDQLAACTELIGLVMREAGNVLHSAPIIQVFEAIPEIPTRIFWETCDAFADDNRY